MNIIQTRQPSSLCQYTLFYRLEQDFMSSLVVFTDVWLRYGIIPGLTLL